MAKTATVGRFWVDESGERWTGTVALGFFGNLRVGLEKNKKRNDKDCDLILTMDIDDMPMNQLRYLCRVLNHALYEDKDST